MRIFSYKKSQELFERASRTIPGGLYGHLDPGTLVPLTDYPLYAVSGVGARFMDADGNELIDYICSYGPVILGYNHPKVNEAAMGQLKNGMLVMGANPVMVELAEYLVDLIAIADWAFFAKNGADVTAYAAMIARAATGRKKIILINGCYHGTAPWMQFMGSPGVTAEDHANFLHVNWNDFEGLEKTILEHPGEIAGFMAAPYYMPIYADSELPADGYWQKVEQLCRKEGIVLILDDVRCGFRLSMHGSNEYFGFKPDLICLSKAIANGFSISALVGTDALKSIVHSVFYTGTYWYDAISMSAALATLKELKRIDAPALILEKGKKLFVGMMGIANDHGFSLKITGAPSMPYVRIDGENWLTLTQHWCGECTKRGAYFVSHHNWFVTAAHTDDDIKDTLVIVDDAFKALKKKFPS